MVRHAGSEATRDSCCTRIPDRRSGSPMSTVASRSGTAASAVASAHSPEPALPLPEQPHPRAGRQVRGEQPDRLTRVKRCRRPRPRHVLPPRVAQQPVRLPRLPRQPHHRDRGSERRLDLRHRQRRSHRPLPPRYRAVDAPARRRIRQGEDRDAGPAVPGAIKPIASSAGRQGARAGPHAGDVASTFPLGRPRPGRSLRISGTRPDNGTPYRQARTRA